MRKILLCILAGFAVLSCHPTSDPLQENPDVVIPVPEPEPEPDPEPEPSPSVDFESSYEAVAGMGVGWNLGNTLESVWTGDTDGRDWKAWETGWDRL